MAEKKRKGPGVLKHLPAMFRSLEKISPALSGRLAMKFFLRPFRFNPPRREAELAEKARIFYIPVDDYKTAIYEWGEGPAVWVLHGWSGRATQLSSIIPALVEKGFKVYGIDAPGHGQSSGKTSNVLLFEQALDELRKRKGTPYAFIGHSLGGAVGFLALHKGYKFQKMVSIGAPSKADAIMREFIEKIGASSATYEMLKKLFARRYEEPFESYTALSWVDPPPEIPILIVHDRDDKDAPFHHAEALLEKLPDAERLITSGLGHNRILRDEKVVNTVVDFIAVKKK